MRDKHFNAMRMAVPDAASPADPTERSQISQN